MSIMIYLPPLRRFLMPAFILLALIVFYRSSLRVPTSIPSFVLHQPPPPPTGIHVPIADLNLHSLPPSNTSENYLSPPSRYFYNYDQEEIHQKVNGSTSSSIWIHPISNSNLDPLWQCPSKANQYTNHIRLPSIVQNISQVPINPLKVETRTFWNPTIMALPYWSENQYLVVSRIVTNGLHQENVLCEANICYTGSSDTAGKGEKPCTREDLLHIGPAGGMRCVAAPISLSVPPTPAAKCEGIFSTYVDIPGFHDPRIFWSGKGEPLMMVNTQSRYACYGLWLIDLRSLYPPLSSLLTSSPNHPSLGPLKSYSTLTELTRNPPSTRSSIEKNWMFFFPSSGESFINYDTPDPLFPSKGRAFAKVLGAGLTTTNLTDPLELPCIPDVDPEKPDVAKEGGHWHQATNSLRLILCLRSDKSCVPSPEKTVFFAIIHRKFPNFLKLPLRYERYFIVWAATPPFSMLGISQYPILMANETANGWTMAQIWDDDPINARTVAEHERLLGSNSTDPHGGKGKWADFTYTVSIAWGRGRGDVEPEDMNVGYLDDEVILGIGIDDQGQGFSRARAQNLLQCLRACPGRGESGLI